MLIMGHQSLLYALSVFMMISLTTSSAEDVVSAPKPNTRKPRLYKAEVSEGDYEARLQDVDTRYYIPDGQCSGLITGDDLGCGGRVPVALWVRAADTGRAPAITISSDMEWVAVRRGHAGGCAGRVWVQLRSACDAPSTSSRREMATHHHPKVHRALFVEEEQEPAVVSRRRRSKPLQLREVGADEHIPHVVALQELEE